MLVVHGSSNCDVCLEPYTFEDTEHWPHVIPCGHVFCKACLFNTSPTHCPMCRNPYLPLRSKKLHVDRPGPSTDDRAVTLLKDGMQCFAAVKDARHHDKHNGTELPLAIRQIQTSIDEFLLENSGHVALEQYREAIGMFDQYCWKYVRSKKESSRREKENEQLLEEKAGLHKQIEDLTQKVSAYENELKKLRSAAQKSSSTKGKRKADAPYTPANNPLPKPPADITVANAALPDPFRDVFSFGSNGVASKGKLPPTDTPATTTTDASTEYPSSRNSTVDNFMPPFLPSAPPIPERSMVVPPFLDGRLSASQRNTYAMLYPPPMGNERTLGKQPDVAPPSERQTSSDASYGRSTSFPSGAPDELRVVPRPVPAQDGLVDSTNAKPRRKKGKGKAPETELQYVTDSEVGQSFLNAYETGLEQGYGAGWQYTIPAEGAPGTSQQRHVNGQSRISGNSVRNSMSLSELDSLRAATDSKASLKTVSTDSIRPNLPHHSRSRPSQSASASTFQTGIPSGITGPPSLATSWGEVSHVEHPPPPLDVSSDNGSTGSNFLNRLNGFPQASAPPDDDDDRPSLESAPDLDWIHGAHAEEDVVEEEHEPAAGLGLIFDPNEAAPDPANELWRRTTEAIEATGTYPTPEIWFNRDLVWTPEPIFYNIPQPPYSPSKWPSRKRRPRPARSSSSNATPRQQAVVRHDEPSPPPDMTPPRRKTNAVPWSAATSQAQLDNYPPPIDYVRPPNAPGAPRASISAHASGSRQMSRTMSMGSGGSSGSSTVRPNGVDRRTYSSGSGGSRYTPPSAVGTGQAGPSYARATPPSSSAPNPASARGNATPRRPHDYRHDPGYVSVGYYPVAPPLVDSNQSRPPSNRPSSRHVNSTGIPSRSSAVPAGSSFTRTMSYDTASGVQMPSMGMENSLGLQLHEQPNPTQLIVPTPVRRQNTILDGMPR